MTLEDNMVGGLLFCATLTGRVGVKPMQPMQLHWPPRHGVWVDCSFLSNTPCGLEFSRNGLLISSLANNALVRMNIDTNDKNERLNP